MTTAFSAARPVVLIGCGNMGKALLKGWLGQGISGDAIRVIEPSGPQTAVEAGLDAAQVSASAPEDVKAGLVLVAVKPQAFGDALPPVATMVDEESLVLSIAAGKSIAALRSYFPKAKAVIRAMPNTPASIGRGITVACGERKLSDGDRSQAQALLEAGGEVRWVKDEALLDVVTAVSGSGPAYVFYLMECLAAAGEAHGLPADLALDLALHTVAGAGSLARQSGQSPRDLRRAVTSPGGTTQAGLEVLMGENGGLSDLVRHTVSAAAKRSKELSQ